MGEHFIYRRTKVGMTAGISLKIQARDRGATSFKPWKTLKMQTKNYLEFYSNKQVSKWRWNNNILRYTKFEINYH